MLNPPRRLALLVLAAIIFANPLLGQRLPRSRTQPAVLFQNPGAGTPQDKPAGSPQSKPQSASPAPAPGNTPNPKPPSGRSDVTLETLFDADSYKLYGEARMVGQLVRSPGVVEFLEPILKLSSPPNELKALIKFLNANAEPLAAAPMIFATMPARSGLPQAIVAIELPSVEEAQKFEPKLQSLLPVIFPPPTPSPTPSSTPGASASPEPPKARNAELATAPAVAAASKPVPQSATASQGSEEKKEPAAPPFQIKRAGSLILISDMPFTFKSLRPVGSKLLVEDPNFRVARDRFSSEPVFLFYNMGLDNRVTAREAEIAVAEAEAKKEDPIAVAQAEASPPADPDAPPSPDSTRPTEEPAVIPPEEFRTTELVSAGPQPSPTPDRSDPFLSSLFGAFFWGQPAWPEAIGVALAYESDSYIIRVILLDPPDKKTTPIPFIPQIISGRPLTAGAPSVLPADTEVFASASLDLPRMYAALLENLQRMSTVQASHARPEPGEQPGEPADTAATEAAFEKKYGFKIREELLPALGNEIAIGGTLKSLGLAGEFGLSPPSPPTPTTTAGTGQLRQAPGSAESGSAKNSPVFLISVSDREAAKALIPRLLDAMGMKVLSLIAQTERRGDTEMVTFAGMLSYAFVDKFLVLSPDVAAVRHVVDSYVNHETLSSNTTFRNLTRWQPREIQGQFYVAPSVMSAYRDMARNPALPMDAATREFFGKLNPAPEAISYALSNDGFGPLHELRLPKNLVLMMIVGISAAPKENPLEMNEMVTMSALRTIVAAQETYKATTGNGSYGSLNQLLDASLVSKDLVGKYGYKIDLSVSGSKFEVTATPTEYGVTGRTSFFVDESGILRGGDRGGAPANSGDEPIGVNRRNLGTSP